MSINLIKFEIEFYRHSLYAGNWDRLSNKIERKKKHKFPVQKSKATLSNGIKRDYMVSNDIRTVFYFNQIHRWDLSYDAE